MSLPGRCAIGAVVGALLPIASIYVHAACGRACPETALALARAVLVAPFVVMIEGLSAAGVDVPDDSTFWTTTMVVVPWAFVGAAVAAFSALRLRRAARVPRKAAH